MALKVQEIKNYYYSFDARTGGPGRLQLLGVAGKVADIDFVDENSPVPAPTFLPDLSQARIYFKRSMLPALIDMLRHEKPVSITINDLSPGFVVIHTGIEPVGEGET